MTNRPFNNDDRPFVIQKLTTNDMENFYTFIQDSIIKMSKVPGLLFKNYLDNMIQKINIEIGLKEFKFDLEVHKNDGTNFKKFLMH